MMNNEMIKYGRKRNGIKRQLQKQIGDWLDSITDESVRNAAEKDVIVTGGAIASMLLGEKVNDYDVYFRTKETTKLVAEYYVNKFNSENKLSGICDYHPEVKEETKENIKGEMEERVCIHIQSAGVVGENMGEYNYFEYRSDDELYEFAETLSDEMINNNGEGKEKYRPVFMSENAITLSDKFQIVIRFYGEPDEIHNNYDFVHATCYWDHAKKQLELPSEALEALLSRTLIYRGSLYPVASIFRMKKFLERGWRISAGQQLKIMWQISEIDLSNFNVMREQLTGVDMAYMHQLVSALKEVDEDKINSTYVAEIIDRIFD